MRISVSKRIFPGLRVGFSFGGKRKPRVYATERIGRGLSVTESKSIGKKRR